MDVLITRPRTEAGRSAANIRKIGLQPFILPLVEIVALDFILPETTYAFDALLATSPHAFDLPGHKEALKTVSNLSLFCVGSQTALAAKKAGFYHIDAVAQTAAQLACLLKQSPARHFLYLAGRLRQPVLEERLTMQGKHIVPLEIYLQRPLSPNTQDMSHLPPRLDSVLVYSSLAATGLMKAARFFDNRTCFLCLSARIRAALPANFLPQSLVPPQPNETALLACLAKKMQGRAPSPL